MRNTKKHAVGQNREGFVSDANGDACWKWIFHHREAYKTLDKTPPEKDQHYLNQIF